MSNIKDHSKFNNAYILAKKQEDNIIDLSFLDYVITLPFTLQQHKEDNLTIYDATKGLSSKKEEGRGFGLPSTIKIISSMIQGELIIASRNAIYYKTYQNELSDNLNSSLVNGTLVSMRFDCTKLPNIFNHLGGNMTTKTINMYERYGDIIGLRYLAESIFDNIGDNIDEIVVDFDKVVHRKKFHTRIYKTKKETKC
ncbi:hypothetical protein [Methanosphaera sp.]